MVGIEIGRRLGKRLQSQKAAERDRRLSAKMDNWAVRHRLLTMLGTAVLCGLGAWAIAAKYDGASVGEVVIWAAVVIPVGMASTWISLTRIKRRNATKE